MKRQEWDVVAIHNIDDDAFTFEFDRAKGNPPYVIPAGEVKRLPRFLANHAVKHLVDKILTKKGVNVSNLEARKDLMTQIVVGEEGFQDEIIKSEDQQRQEVIDRMNQPSELDRILERKRTEEKKAEKMVEDIPAPPVKEKEEEFEGLKKEVKPLPTRKELLNYAEKELNMVLDEKTTAKLTKMTVKELMEELDYPEE